MRQGREATLDCRLLTRARSWYSEQRKRRFGATVDEKTPFAPGLVCEARARACLRDALLSRSKSAADEAPLVRERNKRDPLPALPSLVGVPARFRSGRPNGPEAPLSRPRHPCVHASTFGWSSHRVIYVEHRRALCGLSRHVSTTPARQKIRALSFAKHRPGLLTSTTPRLAVPRVHEI